VSLAKHSNALDLQELLEQELGDSGLRDILDLVSKQSWWISQQLYRVIQVVYPKTRRRRGTKETRGQIIDGIRLWYNEPANRAFWLAVGWNPVNVRNFYVCHIYEESVWDPKHFTNLANLTALPTCLQSLSEWRPVRDLLKFHSFVTFGYKGPSSVEPKRPNYYPKIWRHQLPLDENLVELLANKLVDQAKRRPMFRSEIEKEILAT
jgi:hypothetical protein